MACNLNIKADNGNNSILFKDIAKVVSNPEDAVDLYFYTKTDDFKALYGDYAKDDFNQTKLDENGEPTYESFSQEAYLDDIDYNKVELEKSAEIYKKLLAKVPEIQDVIAHRIDYLESAKDADMDSLSKLKALDKILEKQSIDESIPRFLEMANLHVFGLKRKADKIAKNPDSHIREMAGIYKVSQSYSMIAELKAELSAYPEISEIFSADITEMDSTISNIQYIEAKYISKSMDSLVEEFHKRDRSWSRKDIRKNLEHSSRDVLFTEQILEYMGDSRDRVLSTVGSIMMEAEHNTRRSAIDFGKNLSDVLGRLEDKYSGKADELFEGVIMEHDNGEVHYINPEAKHTGGKDKFADRMYDKLQEVQNDPAMMEFLVFFDKEYQTLNSMLPPKSRMGTRLPSALRSEFELLGGATMAEKGSLIVDSVKKKLQRSNLDMERGMILDDTGKPVKRIPTFYTQKYNSIDFNDAFTKYFNQAIKEGKAEDVAAEIANNKAEVEATKKMSKLISRDLASSLQAFHAMATNYASKNELVHIFESAMAVVGSTQRKYTLVDSGGRTLKNAITGKEQYILGNVSKAKETLETFLDMQLYGQKEKDLGYSDIFGMKIDINSSLRALNNATGLIAQGANVMAGLANIGNGEYNNVMEAIGGEYFKIKDLSEASGMYKQELGGIMADIGARVPSNIINLLEEHYNILQAYGGNDIKATERSLARRLMKTDSVYFVQASGEHFMQIRAGLAILSGTKVYDKSGKETGSLLKAHSKKNGKLIIDQGLYVKDKDGELIVYDTNQQNRISNKIGAVLRKLHGNYSAQTANFMKQDARLALVLKFRNWMYDGVKRRYGKKNPNYLLEQESEGFYRTGSRFTANVIRDLSTLKFQLAREKWSKLSAHEKANIRRFITETTTVILLGISGALMGKAGKLMDEEFNTDSANDRLVLGAFALLNYEVNRLYTEVFAYANPIEAVRLMQSPMASVSVVENTLKLLGQLTNPFETYETGWRKGQNKTLVRVEKLIPVYKQIITLNADGIKDRGAFYEL